MGPEGGPDSPTPPQTGSSRISWKWLRSPPQNHMYPCSLCQGASRGMQVMGPRVVMTHLKQEDLCVACNELGSSCRLFLLSKRDWMSRKFDSSNCSCCYHLSEDPFRWFFSLIYMNIIYIIIIISLIHESPIFLQVYN